MIPFKDVRANIFVVDRLQNFYSSQVMSYFCQKYQKMGLTYFFSEVKRVAKYPNFEKLAHLIQNIEAESTEANSLSHIL